MLIAVDNAGADPTARSAEDEVVFFVDDLAVAFPCGSSRPLGRLARRVVFFSFRL